MSTMVGQNILGQSPPREFYTVIIRPYNVGRASPPSPLESLYIPAVGLWREKRALGEPSYMASLKELVVVGFLWPRMDLPTPALLCVRKTGSMHQPKHTSCCSLPISKSIKLHRSTQQIHNYDDLHIHVHT